VMCYLRDIESLSKQGEKGFDKDFEGILLKVFSTHRNGFENVGHGKSGLFHDGELLYHEEKGLLWTTIPYRLVTTL
jgi:hypothetical protein